MTKLLMTKAKYTKRWKGKDGKWNYEYGTTNSRNKKTPEKDPITGRRDKIYAGEYGGKLKAADRKAISKDLHEMVSESYYPQVPIGTMQEALGKNGFTLLDEDNTEWQGMLVGEKGSVNIPIGKEGDNKPLSNAALHISWYKMGSGKYEVVKYIS